MQLRLPPVNCSKSLWIKRTSLFTLLTEKSHKKYDTETGLTVGVDTWWGQRNVSECTEVIQHSNTKAILLCVIDKRAYVNTLATVGDARTHQQSGAAIYISQKHTASVWHQLLVTVIQHIPVVTNTCLSDRSFAVARFIVFCGQLSALCASAESWKNACLTEADCIVTHCFLLRSAYILLQTYVFTSAMHTYLNVLQMKT